MKEFVLNNTESHNGRHLGWRLNIMSEGASQGVQIVTTTRLQKTWIVSPAEWYYVAPWLREVFGSSETHSVGSRPASARGIRNIPNRSMAEVQRLMREMYEPFLMEPPRELIQIISEPSPPMGELLQRARNASNPEPTPTPSKPEPLKNQAPKTTYKRVVDLGD